MTEVQGSYRIMAVATQGAGGDDEARLKTLLSGFQASFFPFDRKNKQSSARELLKTIRRDRPDLVVMEGTGIGGGIAVMLGRMLAGVPYVVSSGDAVGPFVAAIKPLFGPVFGFYERLLSRYSAGFIGWSPYLAGRALTFGSPRVMTAPGWAPFIARPEARFEIRQKLGIPENALVFGIVGSLAWNRRHDYGYGRELAEAVILSKRDDVFAVIVGDGDGRAELEKLAVRSGGRCILTGRVPREDVPAYLASFDVASLPQSRDGVGMFRYTTKISEYLESGLPVVTGRLPLAYDLGDDWVWRLPGRAPWDAVYHRGLAELMDGLTQVALEQKRQAVPRKFPLFDRDRQVLATTSFLRELLAEQGAVKV